eukprot:185069-Chlamydomonas_euryale.AAC.2
MSEGGRRWMQRRSGIPQCRFQAERAGQPGREGRAARPTAAEGLHALSPTHHRSPTHTTDLPTHQSPPHTPQFRRQQRYRSDRACMHLPYPREANRARGAALSACIRLSMHVFCHQQKVFFTGACFLWSFASPHLTDISQTVCGFRAPSVPCTPVAMFVSAGEAACMGGWMHAWTDGRTHGRTRRWRLRADGHPVCPGRGLTRADRRGPAGAELRRGQQHQGTRAGQHGRGQRGLRAQPQRARECV